MSRITICPRVGKEKTLLPGGEVRHCSACAYPVRVARASLARGGELICTQCAQEADLVPRSSLAEEQARELRALGYSDEQIAIATQGALDEYHAGRKS